MVNLLFRSGLWPELRGLRLALVGEVRAAFVRTPVGLWFRSCTGRV